MYTKEQQQFLEYVREKTRVFCESNPVPVHGFDHAERVADTAREIALAEGTQNVFLCELSGLLHDIGRVPEKYTKGNTKTHHELSFELLKEWFQVDREFDFLTEEEKNELLYAVRYHWCDAADDYESAMILRDADKIDLFGDIGLARRIEWFERDREKIEKSFALFYYCYYWLKTKTARKIVEEKGLMKAPDEYFLNLLKEKIKKIEDETL